MTVVLMLLVGALPAFAISLGFEEVRPELGFEPGPDVLHVGDIDGDGASDLVVPGAQRVAPLLGTGDSAFAAPATTSSLTGTEIDAVGDVRCAGELLDLLGRDLGAGTERRRRWRPGRRR